MTAVQTELTFESTSRTVEIPSGTVHYHESGRPDGHPVVLLHGSGPGATAWSNFKTNIGHLSEHFRVLAPDALGWGKSSPVTFDERDHAQMLVELLDAWGVEKAAVVGNSMGGGTALRFAAVHPDRTSHVVTMGSGSVGTNIFSAADGPTEGLKVLRQAYRDPSPAQMKKLVEIMTFGSEFATDELAAERSRNAIANQVHLDNFAASMENGRRHAATVEQLRSISAPAMIIHGRDDRVVPIEGSLRLVADDLRTPASCCSTAAATGPRSSTPPSSTGSSPTSSASADDGDRRGTTMTVVSQRIEEISDYLIQQAEEADDLGRLPDETTKRLRDAGVVRMLQPTEFGGDETSPIDFFEAVFQIGALSGSAGWVAGVVGIHPFELAQGTRQVQEEIWGEDPDTWIASPYAPMGRAVPVDGGYRFSGRWSFSSGTDLCDWIVLGGLVVDEDGRPAGEDPGRHFVLPRADYEILADSWQVIGLKGTGSKDIVIEDKFVPAHRVIDPRDLETGEAARQAGRGDTALYRMPFHVMFGSTIASGTLALADGALAAYLAHTRSRVTVRGVNMATDQAALSTLGAAAADIEAGRLQFFSDMSRIWEYAQADQPVPLELRAQARRNQVQAVRRSTAAVDSLVAAAGGGAMRLGQPLQRFWRDISMARCHASNSGVSTAVNAGLLAFGQELPPKTRL